LNCLEHFESKEAKRCILALFETVFWKLELSLENVETKEAKWCILALFEMVFWKLELLRKFETKDAKWCIWTLSKNVVDDIDGSYNILIVEICSSLK